MDVAWGDRLDEGSQGQDILGLRGLDQSLEAALVNGITTVSQRGRYLTILPWAMAEFFDGEPRGAAVEFDTDRFRRFLFKVQFLTLACTVLDDIDGDGGAVLGIEKFGNEIAALRRGDAVPIPEEHANTMLLTYFGPCRALGMVANGEGTEPYRISPRGQRVWEARNAALGATGRQALAGDILGPDQVSAAIPSFSLKRLARASEEAALLREALTVSWEPAVPAAADIALNYDKFSKTLAWLREAGALGANALLSDVWGRASSGETFENEVQMAWAEYEGRRRLHYGLELLFSAVAHTITELRAGTVDDVVNVWLSERDFPNVVSEAWPGVSNANALGGAAAVLDVPLDLWRGTPLPSRLSDLSPHARAMIGFCIIATIARQSAALRQAGHINDHRAWGERAVTIVDNPPNSFSDTLRALAAVAVQAHLETTFRKMAAGLRCSLRLFPEGKTLRSTGRVTRAGQSGPRLWNVIRVLKDAGFDGMGGRNEA